MTESQSLHDHALANAAKMAIHARHAGAADTYDAWSAVAEAIVANNPHAAESLMQDAGASVEWESDGTDGLIELNNAAYDAVMRWVNHERGE